MSEAFTVRIMNYRCFFKAPIEFSFDANNNVISIIGKNNSGKSAALRCFLELMPLLKVGTINSDASAHKTTFESLSGQFEDMFPRKKKVPIWIEICIGSEGEESVNQDVVRTVKVTIEESGHAKTMYDGHEDCKVQYPNVVYLDGKSRSLIPYIEAVKLLEQALFVPSLRGISRDMSGSIFRQPVGTSFVDQFSKAYTGNNAQKREEIRNALEVVSSILETKVSVNVSEDKKSILVEIDGQSMKIEELGEGVSQIIYLICLVAMNQPTILLLDEPEKNLHATAQLRLIEALRKYCSHGLVMATHSIGLARSVSDKVLVCTRIDKSSQLDSWTKCKPAIGELLGELSYSTYSDIGYEKLLLVEGTSDSVIIRRILQLLGKESAVAVLPVGGSNLIKENSLQELHELKRISPNAKIIIDSEIDGETEVLSEKRRKFVEDCKSAKVEVHVLKRRAIENYFTDRVLSETFGKPLSALGHFEKLNGRWKKSDHFRIAENMSLGDLKDTDLLEAVEDI